MNAETEVAYLAGFFDGEGCVTVHRRQDKAGHRLRTFATLIQATQKGRYFAVLERFQSRWGGSFKYDRRADVVQWQCTTAAAGRALREMLPYLMVKREKAEIVLAMQNLKATRGNRWVTVAEAAYEEEVARRLKEITARDSKVPVNPLHR